MNHNDINIRRKLNGKLTSLTKEGHTMSSVNNDSTKVDYKNLLNQMKLNSTNALTGGGATNVGAGLTGDMVQQWNMRGANSAAYRKLLEAQETGTIKKKEQYTELISDRYFNDNYDAKTGKVTKPTYQPVSTAASATPLDPEITSGEHLDNMRRFALAAIQNPDSLSATQLDMFEQMRAAIAAGMTGSGEEEKTTVTTSEATPASLTAKKDFHLLTDDENFTVAGPNGEKNYSFASGDSLESIAAAINADSAETGVKAEYVTDDAGSYSLKLTSTATGKDASIRVDQNTGSLFVAAGATTSAKGTDAVEKEADTVATGQDSRAAIAAGLYSGAAFGDEAFTIQGNSGSETFRFANGTTADEMISAINAASEKTGVTAEAIRNAAGEVEGIGLLAAKAGSGNYVQVSQTEGDLFAEAGKTIKVSGTSTAAKGSSAGPQITKTSDLGRVTVDGKTYSFADLAPGGTASLSKNPDAALAVLDQALKDIYAGRAEIAGFDADKVYVSGVTTNQSAPSAAANAVSVGDFGSDAMKAWVSSYLLDD